MCDVAKNIQDFMHKNGFRILRAKKHIVWVRNNLRIVTSSTPSCPYALQNVQKQLWKIEKENELGNNKFSSQERQGIQAHQKSRSQTAGERLSPRA